jgi:hypothetical protein
VVEQLFPCFVNLEKISLAKLEQVPGPKPRRHFGLLVLLKPPDYFVNVFLFVLGDVVPPEINLPSIVVVLPVDAVPAYRSAAVGNEWDHVMRVLAAVKRVRDISATGLERESVLQMVHFV